MTNFCPTIKPGENRLAECLSNQLDMELKGNAEGESAVQTLPQNAPFFCMPCTSCSTRSRLGTIGMAGSSLAWRFAVTYFDWDRLVRLRLFPAGKKLSNKCKEELAAFKIDEGTNINKNLPLGELTGQCCAGHLTASACYRPPSTRGCCWG